MPRTASTMSSNGDTAAALGKAAPELPKTPPRQRAPRSAQRSQQRRSNTTRRSQENSDVLVSAVISTYLLTHLHHVLQRAEFGAVQEGRQSQAANYAQLRKVLCMDARSMKDASATGLRDADLDVTNLDCAA